MPVMRKAAATLAGLVITHSSACSGGAIQPQSTRSRAGVHSPAASMDLPTLVERGKPSVFLLEVQLVNGQSSTGSGFVVDGRGWLVTNHHVIAGAESLIAHAHDGQKLSIRGVLVDDPENDLAILQLTDAAPALQLGATSDLQVGADVAVIGSPRGLESSVSRGVLAAIRTAGPGNKVLQITAAISAGSSGSPVFDSAGRVVGVVAATLREAQNVNIAISVEHLKTALSRVDARRIGAYPAAERPARPVAPSEKNLQDGYVACLKAIDEKDVRHAVALGLMMTEVAEKDPRALECLLFGLYDAHQLDDAQLIAKRLIQVQPNKAENWETLGGILLSLDRFDEAFSVFERALALNPQRGESWRALGLLKKHRGDLAGSETALLKAANLLPNDPMIWTGLGETANELEKPALALKAWKMVANLEARNPKNWFRLGTAQAQARERSAAVESFRKAVTLDPQFGLAWLSLAFVLEESKNHKGACEAFGHAAEADPKLVKAWIAQAKCEFDHGSLQRARDAMLRAIEHEPRNVSYWQFIHRICSRLEDAACATMASRALAAMRNGGR